MWWDRYTTKFEGKHNEPALRLPNGSPLCSQWFAKVLRLTGTAVFGPSVQLTPHGLRRRAAQACIKAGLEITDLKEALSSN